jgi:hypothetical protein
MSAPNIKTLEKTPNRLEIVCRQVNSLCFGVVQIVVHDSKVTQIDKTERVRLEKIQIKTL